MNKIDKQKHLMMYFLTKKYEVYGYISLETLSSWNSKLPRKKVGTFTCKKIVSIASYHSLPL
jgi:hypothetical protein